MESRRQVGSTRNRAWVISLALSCPHVAHRSLHPSSFLRILIPADSTSKRLRHADASDAGAPAKTVKHGEADDSPASSSSHTTFLNLPPEIRSLILQYAYEAEGTEGSRFDCKTLISLVLVSRRFHSAFTPVLYADVKITQPSVLSDFHRSLCLRPSNAGLVRSLHLGQLADLNPDWWPIRGMRDSFYNPDATDEEPLAYLKTSWSERDEAMRPRWCKPHQEWVHHSPNEPGPTVTRTCHERAVTDAISAALKRVGVSLYPDEYADCDSIEDADERFVDINKWTIRVFEAQAILDLYLAEIRRLEDAEERSTPHWQDKTPPALHDAPLECAKGQCGHYPQLILNGFGNRKHVPREYEWDYGVAQDDSQSDEDARSDDEASAEEEEAVAGAQRRFTVTLEQATEQLFRRGAKTDHFDHPLLVARSGVRRLRLSIGAKPLVVYEPGFDWDVDIERCYKSEDDAEQEYFEDEYLSDDDDEITYIAEKTSPSYTDERAAPRSPSDSTTAPSAKGAWAGPWDPTRRRDIIALGRCVLGLTHRVTNLSLTGYMYRCLDYQPACLQGLRCLSLGPITPPDKAERCLEKLEMPLLERLRVAGSELSPVMAERIGSRDGQLGHVRRFEWDYGVSRRKYKSLAGSTSFFVTSLRLLQGGPPVEASGELGEVNEWVSRILEHASTTKRGIPADSSDVDRYFEARLHRDAMTAVLQEAPSPAVRAAWLDGSLIAGAPNRVRVVQSRAAMTGEQPQGSEDQLQDAKALWKDSEKWWQACAVECEKLPAVTL